MFDCSFVLMLYCVLLNVSLAWFEGVAMSKTFRFDGGQDSRNTWVAVTEVGNVYRSHSRGTAELRRASKRRLSKARRVNPDFRSFKGHKSRFENL